MALFWIWLCVSAALVAVTCAGHHHTRHQHRRRSHPGDYNYLADFRLNDSSRASLAPQASIAPPAEPERGRSGGRPSTTKRQEWRARQRQSRGRQRRRPDGTRRHLPELVYSFGNQMAPSLYYRGSEYRTGKYSGHVDVWTIPRQSPVHKPALQEDNRIARVVIAPDYVEKESCLRCPKDQTIFVEPGFSCTQVPKPKLRPCARWTSFPDKVAMTATLGPQPGSLVMEGVYVMRFTFQAGATLPQSCQYQLRVKVLRCPPLTAPDNGGLRCSQGRHWGSRCRFFCLRGFSLSERSVTRCVIKGRRKATWTPHPAPRCSAHQKATDLPQGPSAVPVSTVTSSSDSVGVTPSPSTSTTPGLRTSTTRPPARKRWKQLACRWPKSREGAWLRCDHGRSFKRRIVAKEGTRCQEKCYYPEDTETVHFHCVQGAWRGRRDLNCTNRRLEGCLLPATPKHAELECPGETPREQRVSPGAVCLYRCKKDYDIVMTDPSHRSLECLLDASQWNHTVAPVCKKTGCESPSPLSHSTLDCSQGLTSVNTFPPGTTCEHVCDEGFTIPGSQLGLSQVTCSRDGSWNQTQELLCVEMEVPQLSEGCRDDTLLVHSRNVSFPIPIAAPVFKGFNDSNAMVHCSMAELSDYGTHTNNCTATDTELGTVSWCTHNITVIASGCPSFDSDPYSRVSCSEDRNATEDMLHPVGDVCEYICELGYVIPRSRQDWAAKECMPNGAWSNDNFHLCQRHQNPQLSRGCEDYTVVVDNLTVSFPVPVSAPVFKAFNDTEAAVNCSLPQVIAYGTHMSNCTATDAELGTVSSCTFSVIVKAPGCPPLSSDPFSLVSCSEVRNATEDQFHPVGDVCEHNCQPGYVIPKGRKEWSTKTCLSNGTWSNDITHLCQKHQNPQLSRGCEDYTVVVDNLTVSFPVPVSTPVFKAFNDTEAAVNCSLPQVIAYGTHVSSCTATDAELGTVSSCTFSVIVEAPGCPPLSSDPFSLVSCSEVRNAAEDRFHPVGDVCQHNCQPGYVIPKGRQEWSTKICLSNGTWSNDINHLCQKQLAPVRVSGCVDIEVGTDDLSNVTVPTPVYRGGSGDPVEVLCSPGKLDDFGEHRIECRAEDQELKTSVSCTFKVIVKGETLPRLSEWSSGCVDVEQVHDSFPVVLKTPDFVSSSGDAAVVTCTPSSLHGPGTYNVSCTAKDNKSQAETQCDYVVNARQFAPFRESRCLSLEAPVNGNIMCRRRAGLVTCRFRCADGYTMATDEYPLLSRGYVECTQGVLFDFQEAYGLKHLPQCTRLPSPTYFEGSIMFYVGLPNCSAQSLHVDFVPTVVAGLLNRTGDICLQAKCDNITFVCETFRNVSDPSVHSPAMKVVWTIQAKHNVNSDDDGVPPAEGLIEDLQVLSHQIITSDADFYREIAEVGGQLWQQSFQQSQFSLVCGNEGFTIDHDSGHCVECPTGTFEENRACHPCPKNHYQDVEGQTSCKPCPKHSFSEAGARSADNCTGLGWLEAPEPARDEPAVRVGSDRSPCKPNPCLHQGVCYLQKDGFSCLCTESYRGIRCESARP